MRAGANQALWEFLIFPEETWKAHDGTYKVDDSRKPKEIDLSQPANPNKIALGIYKIEGKTLTISMGAERPKDFTEKTLAKLVFKRK